MRISAMYDDFPADPQIKMLVEEIEATSKTKKPHLVIDPDGDTRWRIGMLLREAASQSFPRRTVTIRSYPDKPELLIASVAYG